MEALIDFVKVNPLYAVGTVLLVVLFVIALVKKAVKLALIAVSLNLGYGYYLNDLAQDYYHQAQQQVEKVKGAVGKAGESVDEATDLFKQAGKFSE